MKHWNPLNGAQEAHIKLMERQGLIEDIILFREAVKGKPSYAVQFKVRNSQEPIYLISQRSKGQPRRFRDLTRLATYLDEEYPSFTKWTVTVDRTQD